MLKVLSLVAGLSIVLQVGVARAEGTKVLDLSKNFANADYNIYGDRSYLDNALVVTLPTPLASEDSYLVSIVEEAHAACLVSGVRIRSTDSGPIFYFRVYIQSIETNNGRCHIGVHLHVAADNTTRNAFLDFTSKTVAQ